MREEDSDTISRLVRARVLRALHRLDRLVRGAEKRFDNDHQLRACIAVVRLAPQMLGRLAPDRGRSEEDEDDEHYAKLFREINADPDRELAGRRLAYLDSLTPEQSEEFDARCKAAVAEFQKSRPGPFESAAEADEYFRTHPIRNISEVEDEQWPPHLRRSSLKKKEETDE